MTDKHLSAQFDAELASISGRVLEMGGLVESQLTLAVEALAALAVDRAHAVLKTEERVNQLEVDIDRVLSSVIARRQPTARDLRLLIAVSKTISNLERVGDEAARIARAVHRLVDPGHVARIPQPVTEITHAAQLANQSLRRALDAFARLDAVAAFEVIQGDNQVDQAFNGLLRTLITYMMEDPRTISASLELVFVAKAIERIGDHAKNLAEQVIYIVKGQDVRHHALADVETIVR